MLPCAIHSEAWIVLSLFLIYDDFGPRCSYIVLIKKRLYEVALHPHFQEVVQSTTPITTATTSSTTLTSIHGNSAAIIVATHPTVTAGPTSLHPSSFLDSEGNVTSKTTTSARAEGNSRASFLVLGLVLENWVSPAFFRFFCFNLLNYGRLQVAYQENWGYIPLLRVNMVKFKAYALFCSQLLLVIRGSLNKR